MNQPPLFGAPAEPCAKPRDPNACMGSLTCMGGVHCPEHFKTFTVPVECLVRGTVTVPTTSAEHARDLAQDYARSDFHGGGDIAIAHVTVITGNPVVAR